MSMLHASAYPVLMTGGVSAPVSEGDVVSYDGTFYTAHSKYFVPYK